MFARGGGSGTSGSTYIIRCVGTVAAGIAEHPTVPAPNPTGTGRAGTRPKYLLKDCSTRNIADRTLRREDTTALAGARSSCSYE